MDAERLRPGALRLAIAALVVADLVRLLVESLLLSDAAYLGPPVGWPGALAESTGLLGGAAVIGAVGIIRWGRTGSSGGGGVALVALATLTTVHTHVRGEHDESFFFTGLLLGGWLLTEASARVARLEPGEAARWGAVGATAFLAGAYMTAGVAKLGSTSWVDGENVRLALSMAPDVYPGSMWLDARQWMAHESWLSRGVAVVVVVIQLGALGMLGPPRLRALTGALLWGMHLGIWVCLGIAFPEPLVALPMMTWPWYARLNAVEGLAPRRAPGSPWPGLIVTAGAVATSALLWLNSGPAAPVFDTLYASPAKVGEVRERPLAHWSKIVSSPSAKSRWTTGP